MANYPHPQKGEHQHKSGTGFKYTVHQDLAADRQVQAQVRVDLRKTRSATEQMERLDDRLGTGQGAHKERTRLQRIIGAGNGVAPVAAKAPLTAPAPSQGSPKGKKARKAAQAAAKA